MVERTVEIGRVVAGHARRRDGGEGGGIVVARSRRGLAQGDAPDAARMAADAAVSSAAYSMARAYSS